MNDYYPYWISNFPYAQVAQEQQRRVAAFTTLLGQEGTQTLLEPPSASSKIILASDALAQKILSLVKNPADLGSIDRRVFEEIVAEVFSGFGFNVELTARTRDGGYDVAAIRETDRVKYLVQCKRPDPGKPVSVGVVRELHGVVTSEQATKGIVVTTTHFTRDARLFEERNKWVMELRDGDQLLGWLADFLELRGIALPDH